MKKGKWILLSLILSAGLGLTSTAEATTEQTEHSEPRVFTASNQEQKITEQIIPAAKKTVAEDAKIYSDHITLAFPKDVKAGDTGSLKFTFDNKDISFDGDYVVYYDHELLTIDEKGHWEALKDGSATLFYGYQPSEKMLEALDKSTLNEKNLKQVSLTIATKSSKVKTATTAVLSAQGMTVEFPASITEGDTGQLEPIIQIDEQQFESDYIYYYDTDYLTIDEEGNWEALQTGETDILYAYKTTDEVTKAIEESETIETDDSSVNYQLLQIAATTETDDEIEKTDTDNAQPQSEDVVIASGMTLKDFPKTVTVGQSGEISAEINLQGVIIDGVDYSSVKFDEECKLVFSSSSNNILVDANGHWTAIRSGEASIQYGYIPTSKMWQELRGTATEAGKTFDISQAIPEHKFTIEKNNSLSFSQGVSINVPETAIVGNSGTFEVAIDPSVLNSGKIDFSHVTFDGEYVLNHDETLLSIDENNNWQALKAGDTTITPLWTPSEKMLAEMLTVVHYSGEEFSWKDIAQVYTIKISESATTTTSDSSGKDPGGKLPQTGENDSQMMLVLGMLLLISSSFVLYYKHKKV